MKKTFKNYMDILLIITAILLVALLIWFFSDSTAVISENFSKAITLPNNAGKGLNFNIDEARGLNLRGYNSQ